MVQRRGSQDCHCVYPVRVELFLHNVSLNSNWCNEFLEELASQLSLRVTQFEIVNFYVVGTSGLNMSMDIAPHTGNSFSSNQVTAMNYSLSTHTVRINPVLVGDYNLINLTWFRPLGPAPGNPLSSWPSFTCYSDGTSLVSTVEKTRMHFIFNYFCLYCVVWLGVWRIFAAHDFDDSSYVQLPMVRTVN